MKIKKSNLWHVAQRILEGLLILYVAWRMPCIRKNIYLPFWYAQWNMFRGSLGFKINRNLLKLISKSPQWCLFPDDARRRWFPLFFWLLEDAFFLSSCMPSCFISKASAHLSITLFRKRSLLLWNHVSLGSPGQLGNISISVSLS